MTAENFSRPGAVDLSGLAGAASGSGAGQGGGQYVRDVTEAELQGLAEQSTRYPIILEFYSARDTGGAALSQTLAQAVNQRAGKFLLARIDVDTQQRLAQSLQVQAVPTVMALIGGQLAPLFQGTADAQQVAQVLDQVSQAAVGNGITGTAEPVAGGDTAQGAEPAAADPRFTKADQALEAGDYEAAVKEFDVLLKETPGDAEATAGRAQAALLARSMSFDPAAIDKAAQEQPNAVEAQLPAADLEIIGGQYEAAFDRLLSLASQLSPEEREPVRVRLLELFEIVGRSEPIVLKARRHLAGLLF